MKKLSIRLRYTLISSLFLLLSCITLTGITNFSANSMVENIQGSLVPTDSTIADIVPSTTGDSILAQVTQPAQVIERNFQTFQGEQIIATVLIVVLGSMMTYFASGYVLRPVHQLSEEISHRSANNFYEVLSVPKSADEIQQLAESFNTLFAEVERSFLLQKEFSANAAHELRTPLAVMQTKLDIYATEPETKELATALNQQLSRLNQLIDDLLLFSRDLPLERKQAVSLLPLLEDVSGELEPLTLPRGQSITVSGEDCWVNGQDNLLERVFYNLMENASKYSPQSTEITVTVRKIHDSVVVAIADNGEGIPAELRERIFEPFYRVDKSRSRAIGGSGMGLAVCKKILDRHNSSIKVIPNSPRGTIFQITFSS